MLKKTYIAPSTNATRTIWANVMRPIAIAATRLAIRATRTTSPVSITRFRGRRSVTMPAAKPKSAQGRTRMNPTTPAFAGECVTASTSSGYAIAVDSDPIVDSTCPDWSRRKSRLRLSGISDQASGLRPREEVRGCHERHDGHDDDLDAVVDDGDERGAQGDRRRLRHAEQHVGGRGDPSLHHLGAAELERGRARDHEPRDPSPEDDHGGEDASEAGNEEAEARDAERGEPEPRDVDVADRAHQGCGGYSARDRADTLERVEHADECGVTVQPVDHDREDERLTEADDRQRGAEPDRQLAQHLRARAGPGPAPRTGARRASQPSPRTSRRRRAQRRGRRTPRRGRRR